MNELELAAETAVRHCINLQSTEKCLVVTDDECKDVGEILYNTSKQYSNDVSII